GARGVTAAVRAVAGEFATADAGGDAPAWFGEAGADTEAARNRGGVGGHRLGAVVVVLAGRQFLHAVGLVGLAQLQVAAGVAAELVLRDHVEELAVAGRSVAGGTFEVARALALEGELGAAQAEVVVHAVAGIGVEVEHVAVVPVAVGL